MNNEHLFNEDDFEEANEVLRRIQTYRDNKEVITNIIDNFEPSDDVYYALWETVGKAMLASAIANDPNMFNILSEIFENIEDHGIIEHIRDEAVFVEVSKVLSNAFRTTTNVDKLVEDMILGGSL